MRNTNNCYDWIHKKFEIVKVQDSFLFSNDEISHWVQSRVITYVKAWHMHSSAITVEILHPFDSHCWESMLFCFMIIDVLCRIVLHQDIIGFKGYPLREGCWLAGLCFNIKSFFSGMGISIIKIRWVWDQSHYSACTGKTVYLYWTPIVGHYTPVNMQ